MSSYASQCWLIRVAIFRGFAAVWRYELLRGAVGSGRVPSGRNLAITFAITSYARFELLGEPFELLGGYKISHSVKIHLRNMHLRSGYYRSDVGLKTS